MTDPNFAKNMAHQRNALVSWVKSQLSGSYLHQDDIINFSPLERYVVALLFPVDRQGSGLDPVGEIDDDIIDIKDGEESDENDENKDNAKPIKQRRYVPPSSVGFSFYVTDDDWQIQLIPKAKRFLETQQNPNDPSTQQRDEHSGQFIKNSYMADLLELPNESLIFTKAGEQDIFNKDGEYLAKVHVRTQKHGQGNIITATLINNQQIQEVLKEINKDTNNQPQTDDPRNKEAQILKSIKKQQIMHTLFDVSFECIINKGTVGNYPSVDYALLSDEEQEIELQYTKNKIYAIGHGAAANWQTDDGRVSRIMCDFMPTEQVKQVTADIKEFISDDVLNMAFLSQIDTNTQAVCDELAKFAESYAHWISTQDQMLDAIVPMHQNAAKRLLDRMGTALKRMQAGIALLRTDKYAQKAFAFANKAMLMQMKQSKTLTGKLDDTHEWRAFQLAFILTTLVSATDDADEFRDTVDLIWFPTGGGKTEAYLGLSAYQIAYRRMTKIRGGGTTIIMRYTLRLLTTQQFLRATRLICALELLRQENPELGDDPINIGLWVGQNTSPNTTQQAQATLNKNQQKHKDEREFSYFVVEKCPWCGTPFDKDNYHTDTVQTFYIYCHHHDCQFGRQQKPLPCQVVDEMLYREPPTLLVATIDKLARLVWEERTHAFFGADRYDAPELIIQDELHLIANELGSVAGIYESALQTILACKGIRPKYVASTATIKEAQRQVKRLFGKDVAVFPPQGLSTDDAFFAKTVPLEKKAGRLYVGYFAPLLGRQKNLAPLASLLLIAPFVLFGHNQDEYETWADAWWTQLIYHGSLKGVGNSHNAFNVGVKDYFEDFYQAFFGADNHELLDAQGFNINFYENVLKEYINKRKHTAIEQLTSINTASENAHTFGRLELKKGENGQAVDVVLATNMVSVGLDVGRLALMVINGQPLTTSEYIQASSRVGRSDVGGVVFVNYYRDQARSLSHYENFYPYHQSFYRFVEPTSVTPYTYQTRRRALHAGLVMALRHGVPDELLRNENAEYLDPTHPAISQAITLYKKQCAKADPERAEQTQAHIDELVMAWQNYITKQQKNRQKLYYKSPDNASASLLYSHGDKFQGLWATLNNMRNVESTGVLKIS